MAAVQSARACWMVAVQSARAQACWMAQARVWQMAQAQAKGWPLEDAKIILAQMERLLQIAERHRDDLARAIERGKFSG